MTPQAPQNTIDDATFDSLVQKSGVQPVAPPTGPQDWYSNMQSTVAQREQGSQDQATADEAANPVHSASAAAGGAANILGGTSLVLPAIDYLGHKIVHALPEDATFGGLTKAQMIANMEQARPLTDQYASMMHMDTHPTATGVGEVAGLAGGLLPDIIKGGSALLATPTGAKVAAKAGDITSGAIDLAKTAAGKVKSAATTVTDAIRNPLTLKSEDEILATPADKLGTLKPAEREVYASLKKAEIDKNMSTLEDQLATEHGAKMDALQTEGKDLANNASTATYEEAQALKPKVIANMQKSSDEYRNLVEQELAPVKDTQVTPKELESYVRNKFSDDPQKAQDIIDTLTKNSQGETTVGGIYSNIKGLQQDIGKAAKKGVRTFTPDEMKTTDAISTLSGFLKDEKGVDLSKANQFWKTYAPQRDEMIKYVQPFAQRGLETGNFTSFANSIRGSVEGTKPMEGDFIKQVENFTGEKIGNADTRAALAKLTQNQKEQALAQTEKQIKADQIKATGKNAKEAIDSAVYDAKVKTYFKENLKKVLLAGGVYEGAHKLVTGSF